MSSSRKRKLTHGPEKDRKIGGGGKGQKVTEAVNLPLKAKDLLVKCELQTAGRLGFI